MIKSSEQRVFVEKVYNLNIGDVIAFEHSIGAAAGPALSRPGSYTRSLSANTPVTVIGFHEDNTLRNRYYYVKDLKRAHIIVMSLQGEIFTILSYESFSAIAYYVVRTT